MSEPSSDLHIPYPWQQQAWLRVQQQVSQNKAPHALLLAGQKGIGKWQFAHALAEYILCSNPQADLACGKCRQCQLMLAQTHPDKYVCAPDEDDKPIKIDQIRQLSHFVGQTSQQGGYKVVILGPTEQLNINSANALLKNLEEPAGDTLFILVSHLPSAVMATIRSRCQLLSLKPPSRASAHEWLSGLQITSGETLLRLAGGSPLIAREMAEGDYLDNLQLFMSSIEQLSQAHQTTSIVSLAKACTVLNLNLVIQWWLQIIHSILVQTEPLAQTNNHEGDHALPISETMATILRAGQQFNRQWLFKFSDKLIQLRQQVLHGSNPNVQLVIEELLMDWQVIVQRS